MTLLIKKSTRFTKDLKTLSNDVVIKAYEVTKQLSENPFDKQLNIKQLKGFEKLYRVVIFKDYRLIYSFDEHNLFLVRIAHRKDIYKKL